MLIAIALISAICASLTTATPATASSSTPLIPRTKLFGNPDIIHVRMSADAKLIAYLAPYKNVINLWVQPLDQVLKKEQTAKPVTFDQGRGIEDFEWTYLPGIIIYVQDKDGDENWRLWKVNVTQEPFTTTVLSDTKRVQANIESKKPSHPEYIVIGLNDRDERHVKSFVFP
uniref:Uncharacterized protein n=1 Tax=Plectus sambesii TaxID=2011161 RepID=A0A914WVT0_9BILA